MAKKLRDFLITLYPAHAEGAFMVTTFELGQDYPCKHVRAATTDDIIALAAAFAIEHGQGCKAQIRLIKGRKPAHFDRLTKDLYYNIEQEAA